MSDRIGWVGLGGMGCPMAANVARAGFDLTVCDLRPEPVAELVGLGAASAADSAAVAAASDVVLVSLPDKAASQAVARAVFDAEQRTRSRHGARHVDLQVNMPAVCQGRAQRLLHLEQ